MKFSPTAIPDVILIEPVVHEDERGFFMETYHCDKFANGGLNHSFVQDNHAKSVQHTLRGLHFQQQFPQGKLIRCLQGGIFDVAVDLRPDSKTYGQWMGAELNDVNKHQLFIPEGFAHGYYVMTETAHITYKCTEVYRPENEAGILWNDPDIGIAWPGNSPILSRKDQNLPTLSEFAKDSSLSIL